MTGTRRRSCTDDELLDRAVRRHFQTHPNAAQPCRVLSEVMRDTAGAVITLANVNGVLAEYRWYGNSDRLRPIVTRT